MNTIAENRNSGKDMLLHVLTGVYHFPKGQAAQIALETVLSNITAPIEKVIFCCFSDSDAEIYRAIYAKSRVET